MTFIEAFERRLAGSVDSKVCGQIRALDTFSRLLISLPGGHRARISPLTRCTDGQEFRSILNVVEEAQNRYLSPSGTFPGSDARHAAELFNLFCPTSNHQIQVNAFQGMVIAGQMFLVVLLSRRDRPYPYGYFFHLRSLRAMAKLVE